MNVRAIRAIPFFLALAWGLNWPSVKIALSAFQPFTLRMIGLGCGALLLLLVAALQRKRLVPQQGSWAGVLIGGTLAVAVFNDSKGFNLPPTTITGYAYSTDGGGDNCQCHSETGS